MFDDDAGKEVAEGLPDRPLFSVRDAETITRRDHQAHDGGKACVNHGQHETGAKHYCRPQNPEGDDHGNRQGRNRRTQPQTAGPCAKRKQ